MFQGRFSILNSDMIDGFLEKIYPYLEKVTNENNIALQRKRFFSLLGDIYEDEDFYTERINAFLEWFLVEAEIQGIRGTVLKNILDRDSRYMDEETRRVAEAMMKSRRSIFLLGKKEKEFAVLEDIFDKERYYVDLDPRIENTERKSFVESRVCVLNGRTRITNTYLKYPERIKKIILKRLKNYLKNNFNDREPFLNYASALFIRYERYRNISVEKIAESLDYLILVK